MAKTDLTAQRVRELFYVNQSGALIRAIRGTGGRSQVGREAGSIDASGYIEVSIDGSAYKAHRIVWLHIHGVWPQGQIDHINGDRRDNRPGNLRDVPAFINCENQRFGRSDSSHGLLGVCYFKGKWQAQITVRGKQRYLGRFSSAEDAHAAYLDAKRILHAGCTI